MNADDSNQLRSQGKKEQEWKGLHHGTAHSRGDTVPVSDLKWASEQDFEYVMCLLSHALCSGTVPTQW